VEADQRVLIFLDASVLVAASRSPSGGSAIAMQVCEGRRFRAAVTTLVLMEARVNIAEKFGEPELVCFYHQLASLEPAMVAPPSSALMEKCIPLTTEEDAHVLVAALECKAAYLLILDRRHLLTPRVLAAGLHIRVMTPGEFLQSVVRSPT
jgi:predicted nucleic acid-binding protein